MFLGVVVWHGNGVPWLTDLDVRFPADGLSGRLGGAALPELEGLGVSKAHARPTPALFLLTECGSYGSSRLLLQFHACLFA